MRSVALSFAFAFAAAGGGCTSYTLREPTRPPLDPLGPPPPNAARVCVVRTSVLAMAVTFPTRDNGHLVGATRGPGHFCWLAAPGEHEVTVETDQVESARLRADPAKAYFLRTDVSNVMGVVTSDLVWIDFAEARAAIDGTPYELLAGVPGDETLPEPVRVVAARPHAVQSAPTGE